MIIRKEYYNKEEEAMKKSNLAQYTKMKNVQRYVR